MPRPLRIHIPGAFYHVTLRGNHRQNTFFSPADRRLFDDITAEVLERFAARLYALQIASLSQVARTFKRSEFSLRESVKHHFNYP